MNWGFGRGRRDTAALPCLACNGDLCYTDIMLEPKTAPSAEEVATRIDPDMPNYVGSEATLLAAIDVGLADIKAGRTVSFAEVAAEFRRNDRRE